MIAGDENERVIRGSRAFIRLNLAGEIGDANTREHVLCFVLGTLLCYDIT